MSARMSPELAAATRKVLKSIAVGPQRVRLSYLNKDGEFPLIVALPSEYISHVVQRVIAVGGSANVAVAFAKSFRLMTLTDVNSDPKTVGTGPASDIEGTHEMSVGMVLLQYDRTHKKTVSFVSRARVDAPASTRALEYA
jgi:hypothetical protein